MKKIFFSNEEIRFVFDVVDELSSHSLAIRLADYLIEMVLEIKGILEYEECGVDSFDELSSEGKKYFIDSYFDNEILNTVVYSNIKLENEKYLIVEDFVKKYFEQLNENESVCALHLLKIKERLCCYEIFE